MATELPECPDSYPPNRLLPHVLLRHEPDEEDEEEENEDDDKKRDDDDDEATDEGYSE